MISIRDAVPADIEAVTSIFAPAVLTGTASFELVPPNVAEMLRRYEAVIDTGYPYIVAEIDGRVVGYAYAGPYRTRPAYKYTVENSVYVAPDCGRGGIGSALLAELVRRCTGQGHRLMVAIIGDSANASSIGLHRKLGFTHVGTIKSVGRKHGRWLDSVIMQLALGEGDGSAPE